jgi:hypothetical protein
MGVSFQPPTDESVDYYHLSARADWSNYFLCKAGASRDDVHMVRLRKLGRKGHACDSEVLSRERQDTEQANS